MLLVISRSLKTNWCNFRFAWTCKRLGIALFTTGFDIQILSLNGMDVCVLGRSRNKQRLFFYALLTDFW